jgi:hypothetical protein
LNGRAVRNLARRRYLLGDIGGSTNVAIHSLIAKLSTIDFAKVGRGPLHPTHPRPELSEPIEDFLQHNSFLESFPDYVEFVRCYAAAGIYHPDYRDLSYVFVSILGFDEDIAGTVVEDGVDHIDEDGFFVFCETEARAALPGNKKNVGCGHRVLRLCARRDGQAGTVRL